MRMILLAASALAFAACNPAPTDGAAKPADAHDMASMDANMKSADTADDANTAETAEGYTFHTYPAKVESVHLPTYGTDVWTATASDAAIVEIGAQESELMPDGKMHAVVKVTPKKSGNVTVKFERRSSPADTNALETRTINFMVH